MDLILKKQQLFPYTTQSDFYNVKSMFTARYEPNIYIKFRLIFLFKSHMKGGK